MPGQSGFRRALLYASANRVLDAPTARLYAPAPMILVSPAAGALGYLPSYPCKRTDPFSDLYLGRLSGEVNDSIDIELASHTSHTTIGDELVSKMSASPSSPNQPTPNQTPGAADDEQSRKAQAAAMERFAEVSLKSVPLPEGVDPNKRATVGEAFKTIKSDDILKVHQAPCSRDGFITGIGSGAAVGFLRYIVGAPVPKAANWAVGSGVAISVLAYEYCQYQRRVERANMKRVVEVVSKKQADMKRQEEEKKLQSNTGKGAPADKTTNKAWYKFW